MERIEQPFTNLEAEKLNEFQQSGVFHPFTCDRKAPECEVNVLPRNFAKDGVLIATNEGWVCPCGKYKQNWAHKFMAE